MDQESDPLNEAFGLQLPGLVVMLHQLHIRVVSLAPLGLH